MAKKNKFEPEIGMPTRVTKKPKVQIKDLARTKMMYNFLTGRKEFHSSLLKITHISYDK